MELTNPYYEFFPQMPIDYFTKKSHLETPSKQARIFCGKKIMEKICENMFPKIFLIRKPNNRKNLNILLCCLALLGAENS